VSYALVRLPVSRAGRMNLATFSQVAGIHPTLVHRFIALGLLEPQRDDEGVLWFDRHQLLALDRVRRLRAGLGLNYSALGLVVDLLDRVAELERQLRSTSSRPTGGRSWT
jgi:chaperone modulatory protein CbpM